MPDPLWPRVQAAFDEAAEREGDAREAVLRELRAADPAVAAEVERLLASDAAPHPLLSAGPDARPAARAGLLDAVHGEDADRGLRERLAAALGARYEVGGELGRGGMAVVFAGVERKHDRPVAIKVMRPAVAGRVDPRRFGVEVRLTAQLSHPHIVPLYDSGEAGGLLYFVSAAVPGEPLAARLEREGALPLGAVREITRGVAAALDHAHERRIVHRDVKPSNVLLHGRLAMLADFGIGKALAAPDDAPPAAPELTRESGALGTPRYMSPEQLRGADVGPASDQYALALVAHETLTGRPATAASGLAEVAVERHGGARAAPSALRPGLPRGVDAVVARALAPDPADRYPSATAFADALGAALDGGGTATRHARAAPERPSVAILPLDNRAAGGDDAYLSEGISEQLIHQLGGVPGLRVLARASTFAAAAQGADPHEVGRRLGARHLVTGSVRRQGERLRIHAELMEVATGAVGWSETYERRLDDVFAVQDEIAGAIATTLRGRLAAAAGTPAPAVPDVRAYEHYLRARHAIHSFTEPGLRRALTQLDRALAILPDNVALLAAQGYAHWQLVNAGLDPDPAHLARTRALAERIDALAPGSHRAQLLFGLAAIHQGRPEDAIRHLDATLAADPTDTDAAFWLTLLLGFRGQPHRAEPHVAMLLATDPLNALHQFLPGYLALMRGQPAAAVAPFRRALAMEPDNPVLRLGCGQAEAMAGDAAAALATLRPLDAQPPGTLFAGLGRGLRRGLGEDGAALTPEEAAAAESDLQWCWTAAQGHALAGELDEATAWMERAVALGFLHYPLAALYDPLLAPLRGTPAFERLLAPLEAAWAARLPQPAFAEA